MIILVQEDHMNMKKHLPQGERVMHVVVLVLPQGNKPRYIKEDPDSTQLLKLCSRRAEGVHPHLRHLHIRSITGMKPDNQEGTIPQATRKVLMKGAGDPYDGDIANIVVQRIMNTQIVPIGQNAFIAVSEGT